MKKLFLLLVSLPFIVVAQSEFTGEFRIDLTNAGSSWNVTFTLTAISARWDENLELTDEYEIVYDNIHSTYPSETSAYFDHILDPGENPEFALGLYKVSAFENGVERAYIYMDWRTSNWISSLDVIFKYDYANKHFKNAANTQIIDHSYQTLWNLTSNLLETSGLEDYWDNCIAVIDDGNDYPKLIWGPFPTEGKSFNVTGYNIYRGLGTVPNPMYVNFSYLTSVGSTQYSYVDEQYNIGNGWYGFYKVAAVDETTESEFSNIAITGIDAFSKVGQLDTGNNFILDYSLAQNYPNPFNPTTTISYSLSISSRVSLKVLDILGREVAELVNEQKEAGTHMIKFDASNLTSGIYLYQIKIGDHSETRKLILQK